MRVISTPTRPQRERPRSPGWWRMIGRRTGTVVEHDGAIWELIVTGAADQMWRQWARVNQGDL